MSKTRKREENQSYLKLKLDPILKPFVTQILLESPEEPYSYFLSYLKALPIYTASESEKEELKNLRALLSNASKKQSESENSSSEDSEDDYIEDLLPKITPKQMKPRSSVSAEAFGTWNKKSDFTPRIILKTLEQEISIKSRLSKSFMFNALDDNEKDIVVKAVEERKFEPESMVITQGDNGSELFLVESGKLECSKVFIPGDPAKFLKFYGPGEAFGELSLLYNTPRAASIKAITNVACWVLDRDCFNHIVKDAAVKKREKYEEILSKVELLKNIEHYEKMQMADALKSASFQNGEYIIRQGDWGDVFYMIEQGTAVALKSFNGEVEKPVKEYNEGDYFGELSLLKGQARAASIKATSFLKCVTLDRKAFKRMLGPLEEIMQRKALEYN